jgi:nicotinamide mononucleotide transporter
VQLLASLQAALAAVTPLEWTAVALALAYLLLAIRQNPWCWPFAIASGVLYLWLFARTGLVMQAALQVFYVAMALYGWRAWRGTRQRPPARVRRWPAVRHAWLLAAMALLTWGNVSLLGADGRDPLVAWVDAFVAWGSVLATLLTARKVLENWLYWIVLDLVAAVLYAAQGLTATAGLFVLYAALAVHGYRVWLRDAPPACAGQPS